MWKKGNKKLQICEKKTKNNKLVKKKQTCKKKGKIPPNSEKK